ncbi:MAG TPA: cob(I)yrinic acid a,c-diamide adenosyltransferase [Candidatus Atribacteria bacterium]|nr:cob(I)yrinic acid a,c-diamide adenosyltransferase [Candidatus Atribacteria bacterium]HPT78322.1 cob(I)yrinic acid a,c-diamide adenosyltransferase [Candidatus Atribacteria bacterium]
MEKGYIQVYTGDGKGKTTAALGLGMRAAGRGLKVLMIQFLKGTHTGELESIKKLAPQFSVVRFGETGKFFFSMDQAEKDELKRKINEELDRLDDMLRDQEWDVLILDEILGTIENGLVSLERVLEILDARPEGMEIVLTGRVLPDKIAQRAHLITEMRSIKHYFDIGVSARDGIEK